MVHGVADMSLQRYYRHRSLVWSKLVTRLPSSSRIALWSLGAQARKDSILQAAAWPAVAEPDSKASMSCCLHAEIRAERSKFTSLSRELTSPRQQDARARSRGMLIWGEGYGRDNN